MALPTSLTRAVPDGSIRSCRLLDNDIVTINTFVEDMFGIRDATTINSPLYTPTQVQLQYVSATQIKLAMYGGRNVMINGALYEIPTAGVTAANTSVYVAGVAASNLAASTVYYVCVFNLAGVVTVDFIAFATGHSTDTTAGNAGVEIKTGDSTRTLVGMIRTNSSSQFVDSATQTFVLSWFNRRGKRTNNSGISATTTSATYVELDSTKRVEFLTWANAAVLALTGGSCSPSASVASAGTSVGFDGATAESGEGYGSANAAAQFINAAMSTMRSDLAEGYHYATLVGKIASGVTGTWAADIQALVQG